MRRHYKFGGYHPQRSFGSIPRSVLKIDASVQRALHENRPVVALESTIVAHGMPFPENVQLCQRLATIFRNKGVEPATIAVKDGICRVGLSISELEDLAVARTQDRVQKCSTRELSLVIAQHHHLRHGQHGQRAAALPQWGATTVAATMTLAHAAGIYTFVTGGIGGVHRNGELTMDVSADLTELARTPVIVVSAGIKSILDISRTLEALETHGVPVVAYRTDEFPAFFSPRSGIPTPARMDDPALIAAAYWAARDLNLSHGMMVGVPNQDPAGANVEAAIQRALRETGEQGITGQAVTPFILRRVAELTGGDSLRSNMALVEQNAHVGADIALALCAQRRPRRHVVTTPFRSVDIPSSKVVVMGGIVLDVIAKLKPGHKHLIPKTSNPASCTESDGGVARNVAEALGRLGSRPLLYSVVGNDSRGLALLDRLEKECNVQSCRSTVRIVENANSATYLALLDGDGDMYMACADTGILEQIQPPSREVLENAEILVMDANPPLHVLRETALTARQVGAKVFFEPTSVPKASEVAGDATFMACLSCATPNLSELSALAHGWTSSHEEPDPLLDDNDFVQIGPLATRVLERMNPDEAHLVVTLGVKGVLLASKSGKGPLSFRHFPATPGVSVRNATGAGDSLCGALVHALLSGTSMSEAVVVGMKAAELSLECETRAVSTLLSSLSLLDLTSSSQPGGDRTSRLPDPVHQHANKEIR